MGDFDGDSDNGSDYDDDYDDDAQYNEDDEDGDNEDDLSRIDFSYNRRGVSCKGHTHLRLRRKSR